MGESDEIAFGSTKTSGYKKGDVLVVFGELFSKGYANGVILSAQRRGLKVIYSTVGRRGHDGSLRPLNEDELSSMPKPLINIPLEAGFDREPDSKGRTPCDQLSGVKFRDWDKDYLDWDSVLESREKGVLRFKDHLKKYLIELEPMIPKGANVLFLHIMAGGVPRAKVIMPVMNRVFKGRKDRFIPSENLFSSPLGKMSQLNFSEVTAQTFRHLVEFSGELREKIQREGGRVCYGAYGYHGTKVLMGDEYRWQTYTPYFQGWAKMELEKLSVEFDKKGIVSTVFNCPEILTHSSSIFQGVELSLYPLIGAVGKEGGGSAYCQKILDLCNGLLKEGHDFEEILETSRRYMTDELTLKFSVYDKWPQQNSMEQMAFMLDSSEKLISMHVDPKKLMTFPLSEEVFKATGSLIFNQVWQGGDPVLWLNHDIVAKQMAKKDHLS